MNSKINLSDKNLIGKILFLLSIILLGVMIAVIFKKPFLETDEWFTKGIIQLSFQQMVNITAIDVHPPLYYIILKIPTLFSLNVYVFKQTLSFFGTKHTGPLSTGFSLLPGNQQK